MQEIWKDIEGFDGKYQVSSLGNIRSMNYNNTGQIRELKVKVNKYGFCEVCLSKNNKTKHFMVARLVAQHFIPNTKNCPEVTHKNNNKLDNSVANLKWVYKSESRHSMYKKGNRKIGKASGNKIAYKGKGFKNYSEMANYYNIELNTLSKRLTRKWTLEEALEIPALEENKGGKPYLYNYYGKLMTVKQLSKIRNIEPEVIQRRLYNGWNVYEATEIMKGEINEKSRKSRK